jgi:hypothetical protein
LIKKPPVVFGKQEPKEAAVTGAVRVLAAGLKEVKTEIQVVPGVREDAGSQICVLQAEGSRLAAENADIVPAGVLEAVPGKKGLKAAETANSGRAKVSAAVRGSAVKAGIVPGSVVKAGIVRRAISTAGAVRAAQVNVFTAVAVFVQGVRVAATASVGVDSADEIKTQCLSGSRGYGR